MLIVVRYFPVICGCSAVVFSRFAVVCRRGVAPIDDVLPLQGAIVFKPGTWGGPRVSFTSFTLPWAEIPLPLQGATGSKPPNNDGVLRF